MILVTGATGTVGSELVQQLIQAGQKVRVLTRNVRKVAHLSDQVERVEGDFDRLSSLSPAMVGIEKMFLVTLGAPHIHQQDINAVEAARGAGVRHIIKLSTIEASHPTVQIGKWHREREQIIEESGIAWTFIRPGMFMSNFVEWWADSIKHTGMVFFPGGKGKVAPIDPYDIAAVAARILTEPGHEGQVYELTGSQLFSIDEIVAVIGQNLGKSLRYVNIPPFAARMWMSMAGMDRTLVRAVLELAAELRNNQAAILRNGVDQVTGRPPRTLQAWCQYHISAFQKTTSVGHPATT